MKNVRPKNWKLRKRVIMSVKIPRKRKLLKNLPKPKKRPIKKMRQLHCFPIASAYLFCPPEAPYVFKEDTILALADFDENLCIF